MSITSTKPGSYPGALITVSLTIALFLIGFCGWLAFTSKELIRYVKQNIEMQVYVQADIDAKGLRQLHTKLAKMGEIALENGHPALKFTTKDKIAENFVAETNEDYKEILGNNPFRDVFTLRLKEEYLTEESLSTIKTKLATIDGVYEVDYARDFINSITKNANKAYIIMSAIVIIFLIATILLINNTIKLALYSQRFIIRTMQLVGATNAFIQKPFLTRGLIQGFIAAAISSILVLITQQTAIKQITGLSVIQNGSSMLIITAILLILGPLIGLVSTYHSIVKYLSIDLDELY